MHISLLPEGPTMNFKLTNVKTSDEIKVIKKIYISSVSDQALIYSDKKGSLRKGIHQTQAGDNPEQLQHAPRSSSRPLIRRHIPPGPAVRRPTLHHISQSARLHLLPPPPIHISQRQKGRHPRARSQVYTQAALAAEGNLRHQIR